MKSYTEMLAMLNAYNDAGLREALEEAIREEAQKKAGLKNRDAAIIKKLVNGNKKQNPKFAGYLRDGEKYVFLDGYRAFFARDSLGYDAAPGTFNFKWLWEKLAKCTCQVDIDRVKLETYAKLAKANKSNRPYIIASNYGNIGFKPAYLLDALDYCKTDYILIDATNGFSFWPVEDHSPVSCLVSPCYIQGPTGKEALIMPCRCETETNFEEKAQFYTCHTRKA